MGIDDVAVEFDAMGLLDGAKDEDEDKGEDEDGLPGKRGGGLNSERSAWLRCANEAEAEACR